MSTMAPTLSEAYKQHKENINKRQQLKEKLNSFINENFLIVEKMDTVAIEQLTDGFKKFESIVRPLNFQSLNAALNDAEVMLNKIASGTVKDSAAETAKVINLFSMLSDFFTSDVPSILKLPMFQKLAQNTEATKKAPLKQVFSGQEKWLTDLFTKALVRGEKPGFLKRWLFGNVANIPLLNQKLFIEELTSTNYNTLVQMATNAPAIRGALTAQQAQVAMNSISGNTQDQEDVQASYNQEKAQKEQQQKEISDALKVLLSKVSPDELINFIKNSSAKTVPNVAAATPATGEFGVGSAASATPAAARR